MNLLQKRLIEASQKYYTDGTSDMTDQEFDEALEELRKEDPTNPIITQVGHGYDVSKDSTGQKVSHKYFAGSFAKCHNWQEFPSSMKTPYGSFGLSVKLDGLSVVLYYENGELIQALSRGDGQIGIDITSKIKKIEPTYVSISDKTFTGAVRGEILMLKSQFEQYKEIHSDASNPRNTATGLINGKYIEDSDLAYLNVILYSVIGAKNCAWAANYAYIMTWLEQQFEGHIVPWTVLTLHEMIFEDTMQNFVEQHAFDFPYDGVVISSPDTIYHGDEVKYTAVAFKFLAESTETEVVDVEWSLTKTKYLVPRIRVKPVQLSGATIQYATGFNAQFIQENKIGPGAVVEILRSGEVIPYIRQVVKPADVVLPDMCPFCEAKLAWNGVHLQCPNSNCGDAVIQDLLIWVKNIAPTIGLGDKLILGFFHQYFDNPSISAIYNRGPIVIDTDSIQQRLFLTMYNNLFVNEVKLEDAIQALNIPRLGELTSRKLAQNSNIVKMIYQHAHEGTELSVTEIVKLGQYIGEANSAAILENIHKFDNLTFIYKNIVWTQEQSSDVKKVAITGKLSVKRSEFEALLRSKGFIANDAVSADTFALITDDPNSSSSKNAKATKLNIPKLSEQEFRSKYLGY